MSVFPNASCVTDLPLSDTLSIVKNGPQRFEGRKLGVLITDGADAELFAAITTGVEAVGGVIEIIAPRIGGAALSDGELVPAHQKIDGGPSVLYDGVALLISADGAALLFNDAPTRDFIADAFAHCKFIGYTEATIPLLDKAGIAEALDEGCVKLDDASTVEGLIQSLGQLRICDRELGVDLDA